MFGYLLFAHLHIISYYMITICYSLYRITLYLIQSGPLKSSPENVVDKKNTLLLFKLPVMLYNLSRDQVTFKWATFSILAYSLSRPSTTSTYHLYNLSRGQVTYKWVTLYNITYRSKCRIS